MDELEVFEHAQTMREDQLSFFITRLHVPVFPIKVNADLPQHFLPQQISRSALLFLDDNIFLKMQTQDLIADVDLPPERLLLDLSLGSFVFRDRERDIFTSLKNMPHPNLVRELEVGEPHVAFFESLSLLTTVWGDAEMPRRRRWAVELVSAFAHLENMGLALRIRVEDLRLPPLSFDAHAPRVRDLLCCSLQLEDPAPIQQEVCYHTYALSTAGNLES
ncbi:hypothetical protein NA56DRAFT_454781 [Hyaloscypha hepaticicola]|uniref:Uncharacterized protein n=1 Tax=Hyaloscypha hepaticicola TaxID=2082293 RepID=A0A2J6QEW8_9HELO|nr:hypothetical protein NA56DRAFT_454781 [Hyaloscypha hepaticicola]